jgi:hypothetical protein
LYDYCTPRLIRSRKEGLKFSDLPNNYQDAIRVLTKPQGRYRRFNIPCSTQDSRDDKVRELSRVRSYYENALCVIATSGANSPPEQFQHQSLKSVSSVLFYGRLTCRGFWSPSSDAVSGLLPLIAYEHMSIGVVVLLFVSPFSLSIMRNWERLSWPMLRRLARMLAGCGLCAHLH